jgi:hypothetical protein
MRRKRSVERHVACTASDTRNYVINQKDRELIGKKIGNAKKYECMIHIAC